MNGRFLNQESVNGRKTAKIINDESFIQFNETVLLQSKYINIMQVQYATIFCMRFEKDKGATTHSTNLFWGF